MYHAQARFPLQHIISQAITALIAPANTTHPTQLELAASGGQGRHNLLPHGVAAGRVLPRHQPPVTHHVRGPQLGSRLVQPAQLLELVLCACVVGVGVAGWSACVAFVRTQVWAAAVPGVAGSASMYLSSSRAGVCAWWWWWWWWWWRWRHPPPEQAGRPTSGVKGTRLSLATAFSSPLEKPVTWRPAEHPQPM
jgi:hypothetical protein